MPPFLIDLHSGMSSIADLTHLHKPSSQSKDSNFLALPSINPTKMSPFRIDLHSGMAEWDTLPKDILVLIAERLVFFEDFLSFCFVCKWWQSISKVSSVSERSRTLPPRFPWVMLTDIAETNFPKVTDDLDKHDMLAQEVEKNEYIEGMNKRRFFSFSTSKIYEFELPEATRKKCLGVGHGWLLTVGYDLQINLLHPFSRHQVGLPPFLSFTDQYGYDDKFKPQTILSSFVRKAVMSSNPYNSSSEDCVVLAIYGQFKLLAFARPGDKVWTDIYPRITLYRDVVYYKGKFYAIDLGGVIVVCDIDDVKNPTTTPVARLPKGLRDVDSLYLVESSGSLLVVVRFRKGPIIDLDVIRRYVDVIEDDKDDKDLHYTVGFSIFKLEDCLGDGIIDAYPYEKGEFFDEIEDNKEHPSSYAYPYKLTPVKNLGDNSLFLGLNASASLPSSDNVEANHIYFSDDEAVAYARVPYGGGNDTGIYNVESRTIRWHYASKFTSHLTPPLWYI